MKRSVAFRIAAYNKVFPEWWHGEAVSAVIMKLKRINRIISKDIDDLEFRRVYIPKGDTFRPLGVPSGEWRVVMHMYNNFLTQFLYEEVAEYNHAYLPKRGTLTAWKAMILQVIKHKYIYEFDIKQFFPNVDIDEVTNLLQQRGVPKGITYYLENINRQAPILPEEEKLDEKVAHDRYKCHTQIRNGQYDPTSTIYEEINKLGPVAYELMKEDGYTNIFEWAQAQWAAFDNYGLGGMGNLYKGLPQGLNTSPILSILTLTTWHKELKAKGIDLLMYADDGILFSEVPFEPFAPKNQEFSKEKSGWVRKIEWITDLKFVGLKYLHQTEQLQGNTRNGSTLTFGTEQSKLFKLLRELLGDYSHEKDLENLAISKVFGLVQSNLFNGKWNELKYTMKEWAEHPSSWWGIRSQLKGSKTMSSTAAQYLGYLVKTSM